MDVVAEDSKADRALLDRQLKQDRLLKYLGAVDEVLQHERTKRVRFHDEPSYDGGVLCPSRSLNIFEVSEPVVKGDSAILSNEEWQDVEFEVALDSGSQDHVCDELDCPGLCY